MENCNKCGGQVEGWYASMNEYWDGEPGLASCAECGIAWTNKFRAAAGLELQTVEGMYEFAQKIGCA